MIRVLWAWSRPATRLPLGPYSRAVPRVLWWSQGGALSYERGTPVLVNVSPAIHPPHGSNQTQTSPSRILTIPRATRLLALPSSSCGGPVQTVVTRVAHGKPVSTDRLASASA